MSERPTIGGTGVKTGSENRGKKRKRLKKRAARGGDYHGANEERVGEWAGDLISVEKTPPENFKKNDVSFSESNVYFIVG